MLIQNKTIWTPDNSWLLRYKEGAEAGEFVIGQELYLQLINLSNDILDSRYVYNTDMAQLMINFMENCVRLTKSPFYNKPMILMTWQKAFIEAIYSFKMAEESAEKKMWIDRFKNILLLIARKNTKSETSSAIALGEFVLGPAGADIVASSNDDAQASIVYDAIDTMRQLIDPNDADTKRNQRYILNKATNTKIYKLSDRTKNKEGRNIDFAVLDEVHEMKKNTIAKSIEQSQSLKDNPKFIKITTEGFVEDGFLDEELIRFRASIKREVDNPAYERMLAWLYTQDSESEIWNGNRENRLWMKSNPTLGTIKQWAYLEEQVALARESKSDRIFVLPKDFNQKQNVAEAWLDYESYNYDSGYDIEDLRGRFAIGAVDLAETTDLCAAKVMILKPEDKHKYIISHYFIPESKLEESDDERGMAKYKEWRDQGLLTVTEGDDVDLAVVADWFYKLYKEYDIKLWKCGYDQRFSKDWINRMAEYGWLKSGDENSDLIMIKQDAPVLSNAIKLAESELKHELVLFNNNEMDKWCLGNAGVSVRNAVGQVLLVKIKTEKRIDGAVALAILYEMYRRYRTTFKTLAERKK
jgi:phage terminase large subunit-like protein